MDWSTERAAADLDDHLVSCGKCSAVVATSELNYPEVHLMENLCDRGQRLTAKWLGRLEDGWQSHVRRSSSATASA